MKNATSNRVPAELPFEDDDDDLAPTDPPKATKAATAVGGAIWEVVGPAVTSEREHSERSPEWSEPPEQEPEPVPQVITNAANAEPRPVDTTAHELPKKKEPHALIGDRMSPAGASYRDHDLEKWENLVERGAWEQLAHDLGNTPHQSPAVHLLQVIAKRETLPADDKEAGKLAHEAIQALANLLGVPASSPTALMLAKRLLRRNPVWTATQPAAGVSLGIVFAGLAAGAGIGWLVTKLLL